jgi:hypothetical protein
LSIFVSYHRWLSVEAVNLYFAAPDSFAFFNF